MSIWAWRFGLVFFLCALPCFPVNGATSPQTPFFWGLALDGYPITPKLLEETEKETRLHAQLVVFFLQWPSSPKAGGFPGESLNAIWEHGAIPCVTWEPMCYENGKERMITHQQILNGEYDAYIKDFAKEAKRWERPFIIRFAHEMNLSRYHWGSDVSGYGPKSPEIYRETFRYVVTLFREAGALNVLWAFCPNVESVPNTSFDPTAAWNQVGNYYPGNDYVDIMGMDGYNWGTTRTREKHGWDSRWRSWQEIFSPLYDELKSLSSKKPLFVFETATVSNGGKKSAWIKDACTAIRERNVQGIAWFQVKKEEDWRINSENDDVYLTAIRAGTSNSQQWITLLRKKDR